MRRLSFLFAAFVPFALLATGCSQPQLGQCEVSSDGTTEAEIIVLDANGYPAYAGQAMVQEACSSCHSVGATGSARRGAPAHLNFDAVGSRSDDPMMPDMMALGRLDVSRQSIFDHRFDMFSSVDSGSMPPGAVGQSAFVHAGYTFLDGGDALPPIASAEGKEIYRTWLACGGPMVLQSAEPGETGTPGARCAGTDPEDHCYYRSTEPPIEPTWTAIYDTIIVGGGCVGCHGPGPASFIEQSALDLSDKDMAYSALVGVAAMGMPCGPDGAADRIVAGDADGSMLVHKLEGMLPDGGDVCGDSMPLGVLLPPSQIAVVRQWIDDGAMDN